VVSSLTKRRKKKPRRHNTETKVQLVFDDEGPERREIVKVETFVVVVEILLRIRLL